MLNISHLHRNENEARAQYSVIRDVARSLALIPFNGINQALSRKSTIKLILLKTKLIVPVVLAMTDIH